MAMSRASRRLLIASGGTLAFIAVLVATAYGTLQTSWAHARIAAAIEKALSSENLHVKIGSLDGALPRTIILRDVSASDTQGIWAKIGVLKVAWRPWRLLVNSLDIDRVDISDATLERLPQSREPTEPQGSSPPFKLPEIGIEVSAISLDMALGPALAEGKSERLQAKGSARYGMGDGIHLTLDATQGAANGSRLTARIHANPEDETLELDIHAHEAKDGLVSRLAGVAEDGPFDVDVAGEGTLADWNGTAKASFGTDGRVDATIKAFGKDTHEFSIKGMAMTPPPLTGRFEALAEPPYDFDINFSVARGALLTFTGTTVKTAGARLEANGVVDLSSGSIDMGLGLEPANGEVTAALIDPLSVPSLAVNGHIRGYLSKPYVELSAAAASFTGDGVSAGRTNLTAELDFDTGDPGTLFTFDASATVAKLAFARGDGPADPPSDLQVRSKGAYHGMIRRLSFGDLQMRTDWASVNFAGGINLGGESATMLNGLLNAELRGLPMGGPAIAQFFKQPARLQTSVVYLPEGERLRFAKLSLNHPKISADGDVEIGFEPQTLRGDLKARIGNPAAFSDLLGIDLAGGPVNLTLVTEPSGTVVNSTLTASADRLTVSGTALKAVKAAVVLKDVETQAGTLDVAFTGPAGAVKATTSFARSDNPDRVALNGLRLMAVGGQLAGNLVVPLGGGAATGSVSGQFASLDAISTLVGADLRGSATFSMAFSDIGGQQGVTGNLQADGFEARLADDRQVRIKHITVQTGGDIAKLTEGVPFSLDAQGVSAEDVSLDTLSVSGNTNFRRADYKIDAKGDYHGAMTLTASGDAAWDQPEKTVRLESLDATHAKTTIRLVKPVSLIWSADGLELMPTSIEVGGGQVDLSAKRGGDTMGGHLALTDLPLDVIHAVFPDGPAAGTISGTADLTVTPDRRSATAKFRLSDLAISVGERTSDRMSGTVDATWRSDSLNVKADFAGQGGGTISMTASTPLLYEPQSASFRVPEDGRLRGDISWHAEIGPFWNAFGPDTETLEGPVDASLTLGGTVSAPSASGDITLHDGRFVDLDMGTVLQNLTLKLEASRREIRLIDASATDGGTGKVTASGSIGLDRDDHFPIKLDVTADKAKLVRRTDVTATVSGKLTFDKQGKSSTLQGSIRTDNIDAILVDLSSGDVIKLNVTEIGPDGMVMSRGPQHEADENSSPTMLDVSVTIPGQAFIRGRGLDSEWKGNLKITGPLDDPRIVGALNVVRGNFKFAGRTFDLQRGQISFQGSEKIDPDLNVQAVYTVTDLTATVNVTGRSSAPKVSLSSTPAYPQDEILSRILFGSSVAELSPLQAVQLADAVRGLGKPGGGLLGSARSAVGLDVLQIGSASQGGGIEATTITGGKYIAKNIYLEVESAANGSQEKVGVDVGLTKNLSVQSNVSPQQGTQLGLKWKHDY
jgi:translocation and assembly module TamB